MKRRCTWCDREYDSEDLPPSCETCGHESFEAVSEDDTSPFVSGTLVWTCTNCGREHVKHSPPCSRCGNHDLEKRETEGVDPGDVSSPGYLDVGKPYLAGVVMVVGLVALVVTGVVPFPGVGGPPEPPTAPGDSDRSSGLDLGVVETSLHERFESEREAVGSAGRTPDGDGTGAYIEYRTRHQVAVEYDPEYDGSMPSAGEFDLRCESQPTLGVAPLEVDIEQFDDESAFAEAIAEELLADEDVREAVLGERNSEAITVHVAPDGTVFVGYMVC